MNIDYIQFPIEIFSFIGFALITMKLKDKYPNIMFPPNGVECFLPPTDQDIQDLIAQKEKKIKQNNDKKPALQIKLLQSSSIHFAKMPFSNELELTVMFLIILVVHYTLMEIYKAVCYYAFSFIPHDSHLLFYFEIVILGMILANLFKTATIGGFQSQETRMAIIVSALCTVTVLVVFFGFKQWVGINIKHEFQKQQAHLEILLYETLQGISWSFFSRAADFCLVILAFFLSVTVFCVVPVIIRFVNCWTDLRQDYYKPVDSLEQVQSPIEPENTQQQYFLFTGQVIIMVPIIALNINSVQKEVTRPLAIQAVLAVILSILQALTYRTELNRHMQKGYIWLQVLIDKPELFPAVQKRVAALYRGLVAVSYQLLGRIVIPLLLLLILLQKEDLVYDKTQNKQSYLRKDFYCQANEATVMQVLRGQNYCYSWEEEVSNPQLVVDIPKQIIRRVNMYSLTSKTFLFTVIQFLYFNFMFLQLLLTISYMFFLNKTQTVSNTQLFQKSVQQDKKPAKKANLPEKNVQDEKKQEKKQKSKK